MSYVVALPEMVSAASVDVASIGSLVTTANQGVAEATTGVLAAAEDEVSGAIAALFSAHGRGYQALSAQVASFHERFVQTLTRAAGAYAAAEAANALNLSALETSIAEAANPLSRLLELPPLGWYTGNAPSPYLTWPLGLTVQYGTYDGMGVVRITPPYPTGEYVVAMHGGGFLLPPSFFHWIHYSVMSYQTGATMEVPIYPLVWQGGTAGVVVPKMAGLVSSLIAQHGTANVSVIGDSAGGNLALASVQYMVAQGDPVPSRMVLLSPWLDVASPWREAWSMQLANSWAGNLPVNNFLVSPLYGSLGGLPPTYVYSGSWDPLDAQASVLRQAAIAQGAPISFILANFQVHDWVIGTPGGLLYWPQINQQLGIA